MRTQGLWADPLDGEALGHRMRQCALVWMAVTWALAVALARPGFYPPWFTLASGLALMVPTAGGLLSWASPTSALRWTQALVIIAALLRIVEAAVANQPPGWVDYPPLSLTLTMAMGITGIALRATIGLPVVLVSLAGLFAERLDVVGLIQSVGETVYSGAAGVAGFMVARVLVKELRHVHREVERTLSRRSEALLVRERAQLAERWDALVHDTILASLALGSRADQAAAPVAGEALLALKGEGSQTDDPEAELRSIGQRLGLVLDLSVEQWPSGRVGAALLVATAEALTNVARHSGQRRAAVLLTRAGSTVEVSIRDEGRGFEGSPPIERIGMRQVIAASMRAVDGRADVCSRRDQGTLVILTVETAHQQTGEDDSPTWRLKSLAGMGAVMAAQIFSGVAIGTQYLDANVVTPVAVAGLIAIPILTGFTALTRVHSRWWLVLLVGIALVWATLWANLRDPAYTDWRTWFVGSFNSAVVLITLRDRLRSALLVIATATGFATVAMIMNGHGGFGWAMTQATLQTVIWAVLAGFFRRFMDSASETIAIQQSAQAEAKVEQAVAEARTSDIARRRQSLDHEVVPMLRRLANGDFLDSADRRRCAFLESATRDQLTAGTVLTEELVAGIALARQRGVRVSIAGAADPGVDLEPFARSSLVLLDRARPGDRVQLRWRTPRGGLGPTTSLVGVGIGRTWDPPVVASLQAQADVSVDDDSVLITLRQG